MTVRQRLLERTRIEKRQGAAYTLTTADMDPCSRGSIVSMNMWGFTNRILGELNSRFKTFLDENLKTNPLKAEFFLPDVVGDILKEDKATVRVLKSHDKWYGVTYKEDKERVVKAIAKLKKEGFYPEILWNK